MLGRPIRRDRTAPHHCGWPEMVLLTASAVSSGRACLVSVGLAQLTAESHNPRTHAAVDQRNRRYGMADSRLATVVCGLYDPPRLWPRAELTSVM